MASISFTVTLGHHGFWSLTPIFFFSLVGLGRLLGRVGEPTAAVAGMTTVLTIALLAFYTWNPSARNYGGSTQGLRRFFWLIPFWLLVLPKGVETGRYRGWVRWLSLLALSVSLIWAGYAPCNPWTHPWIHDALEHLDFYRLPR